MRVSGESTITLEKLFRVATDAEVGLQGRTGRDRREGAGRERLNALPEGEEEEPVDTLMAMAKGGAKSSEKRRGDQKAARQGEDDRLPPRQCWVCDPIGHNWFKCPIKKPGKVCPRCGSAAHRLFKCPQRLKKDSREGLHRVSLDEARVMAIARGPEGSRLLYYPIQIGRERTSILVDSGASVNCVDEELLARTRGRIVGEAPGRPPHPRSKRSTSERCRPCRGAWTGISGGRRLLGG